VLDGERRGATFRAYGVGSAVLDGFTVQNGTVGVQFDQANDGSNHLVGTVQNSIVVNNDRGVEVNGDARPPPRTRATSTPTPCS
jgi:hypothetical protein